ncbi:MAG: hypothetical protein KDA53_11275 [Hyphomonas sp.]|nr:hypothetical protein [Hyphomonas sp.]
MRRLPSILLLSACLVPTMAALENEPEKPEQGAAAKDLSTELETFVRDAIDEGLLKPAGTQPAEDAHAPAAAPHEPAPHKVAAPEASHPKACASGHALDFTPVAGMTHYQELYAFREGGDHPAAEHGGNAKLDLARGYLALGMYSEALMTLRRESGPDRDALRKLALMLEQRQQPDVAFFEDLAKCQPSTAIWSAAARLAVGDEAASDDLNTRLSDFRKLPLQLRIDLASVTIPTLTRTGHRGIARKMIADFTEEQVAGSPELRFVRALIEFDAGQESAGKTVHGYIDHPRFQEAALAALMAKDEALDSVREDILLGDLMLKFGQSGHDMELASSIDFALTELSERSRYQPIIELAAMPALQNPEAQGEVRRQLVASLDRDLKSDETIRVLAATDLLVQGVSLLEGDPATAKLYNLAAQRSVELGFGALAERLAETSPVDRPVAEEIAALAFRRGNTEAVYKLADNHPQSAEILRFAALSAVRDGNATHLATYESLIHHDPGTILELIEEDAASGHWIVGETIYAEARQLTGEDAEQRVARVLALRGAARRISSVPQYYSMSSVPATLNGAVLTPASATVGKDP